ncbi:MAG: phosphohydrolase [bacterium]|nr:phosphohydrolase [bacterium]
MAMSQCPGQDRRYWKPADVFESPCSCCGEPLEFWKDDPRRRCHACGGIVSNPRFDLGCAQWCQFAANCLGQPAGDAGEALVDALIREMRVVFGDDQRRIRHALAVLDYAEQILAGEGGDPLIVRAAAVLHEGPPIARPILERLGVDAERAGHVLRIIGSNQSVRDGDTLESRILWDADRLANISEECGGKTPEEARILVEHSYRTATGRAIGQQAVARFLGTPRPLA